MLGWSQVLRVTSPWRGHRPTLRRAHVFAAVEKRRTPREARCFCLFKHLRRRLRAGPEDGQHPASRDRDEHPDHRRRRTVVRGRDVALPRRYGRLCHTPAEQRAAANVRHRHDGPEHTRAGPTCAGTAIAESSGRGPVRPMLDTRPRPRPHQRARSGRRRERPRCTGGPERHSHPHPPERHTRAQATAADHSWHRPAPASGSSWVSRTGLTAPPPSTPKSPPRTSPPGYCSRRSTSPRSRSPQPARCQASTRGPPTA